MTQLLINQMMKLMTFIVKLKKLLQQTKPHYIRYGMNARCLKDPIFSRQHSTLYCLVVVTLSIVELTWSVYVRDDQLGSVFEIISPLVHSIILSLWRKISGWTNVRYDKFFLIYFSLYLQNSRHLSILQSWV